MTEFNALAQVVASSLATGAVYAAILFGMLIVYRVSKAVNFAQGALGMVAAAVAFSLASTVVPLWLAIVVGVVAAALISYGTDRFVLEPITRRSGREGLDLVVTLGLLLLITAVAEQLFGTTSRTFFPLGTDIPVKLGSVYLNLNQVVVTIGVIALLGVFAWFLSRTPFGLSMRAVASDPDLASSMGLNVKLVRALTWGFAGLITGIIGIVVASRLSVDPYYMQPFLIKAVIAGLIGGLDRLVAPLAIAFGLAIFEGLTVYFAGTNYGTPAVFALVIVLLAVLPKRFLSEKGVVRV